jgi:hypothetical protein
MVIWLLIGTHLATPSDANARTLQQAIDSTTRWIERTQNLDGTWGYGATKPLVTAETVLALSKVGRASAPPAQRAIAWLRTQTFVSIDYRARRVRALKAAGVDVSAEVDALEALGVGSAGWGPISGENPTSYDTALVLAALGPPAQSPEVFNNRVAWVLARRHDDNGWSGDGLRATASELTATGEITRAMAPPVTNVTLLDPTYTRLASGPVAFPTPILEIASRLAAFHAKGVPNSALSNELLADSRFELGEVWDGDPYVNAVGLLALATTPGGGYSVPQGEADLDRDGIPDLEDVDQDGDGVLDLSAIAGPDEFETDPTESLDTDDDAIGNNADLDDDGDGVSDLVEIERGSNPLLADTDGDLRCDGPLVAPCTSANDACPTIAYAVVAGIVHGVDTDGDGVCTPLDACDTNPTDFADLNNDGQCDVADNDDDGDGFLDLDEVAMGTDPRTNLSVPPPLDPAGDLDRDGIGNVFEGTIGLSPYRADTDGDGALDWLEAAMPQTLDPDDATKQPPAVLAAFSSGSPDPDGAIQSSGGYASTASFGQVTPVGNNDALGAPSTGALGSEPLVCLDGFQPVTILGRDLDGDGIESLAEGRNGLAALRADTDRDGFVDGAGGLVAIARVPDGRDLQPDGFADGETDHATDPTDPDDHPGRPGDVAPLGLPNGEIDLADLLVERRIVETPALVESLIAPQRDIATEAADFNGDTQIRVDDLLQLKNLVIP